ncbi:hypothetical protein C8Q78DRAFT_225709 [Trametes maxima]|nr:hypothetical protein C8Q78DRAFT_225709 [Trametes maxima]
MACKYTLPATLDLRTIKAAHTILRDTSRPIHTRYDCGGFVNTHGRQCAHRRYTRWPPLVACGRRTRGRCKYSPNTTRPPPLYKMAASRSVHRARTSTSLVSAHGYVTDRPNTPFLSSASRCAWAADAGAL